MYLAFTLALATEFQIDVIPEGLEIVPQNDCKGSKNGIINKVNSIVY